MIEKKLEGLTFASSFNKTKIPLEKEEVTITAIVDADHIYYRTAELENIYETLEKKIKASKVRVDRNQEMNF